jgi:hypothetical protein
MLKSLSPQHGYDEMRLQGDICNPKGLWSDKKERERGREWGGVKRERNRKRDSLFLH